MVMVCIFIMICDGDYMYFQVRAKGAPKLGDKMGKDLTEEEQVTI